MNTYCQIDLDVLKANVRAVRSLIAPRAELIIVVKANAYGHGMVPVARTASDAGARWFAVAHVHEGVALRAALPATNILVLGVARGDEVADVLASRLVPVIVDEEQGLALAAGAERNGKVIEAHLKVDTGMGRLGVSVDRACHLFETLHRRKGLNIAGICTHFASVETRKASLGPTQMERFLDVCAKIEKIAGRRLFRHVSSSRAFQYFPDWDLDAVRPGIILYGYGSSEKEMRARTNPILQWKSRVVQAKQVPAGFPVGYYSAYITPGPTTIATVAVGYADGYHRALSNKGIVLIGERRCQVVGRISMNWITVDCGPESEVRAGDEVVLIGKQGTESIWADELARMVRTIPYEILTSITPNAPRRYAG
jgi:alanine racemase